jgi:phosphotransferase system enzyme I (PtsI)
MTGIPASPGRASGPVVRVAERPPAPPPGPPPVDPDADCARVGTAVVVVGARLRGRAATLSGAAADVLDATAAMAADPALLRAAHALVRSGRPAPRAVHEAATAFADSLTALGGHLAERAHDVRDVRDRLVAELLGLPAPGLGELTGPAVLVADDLAPVDAATLRPDVVRALVTTRGGPTGHTAVLVRALGIPAVVGCAGAAALVAGTVVLVDGGTGRVAEVGALPVDGSAGAPAHSPAVVRTGPGRTADGHAVPLLANVGDGGEARRAAALGAEGVGLLRTELAFLAAAEEPGAARQQEVYGPVFAAFPGRPVVARTLDAGADKPLPFLARTRDSVPGARGIRLARAAGVLDRQLAALVASRGAADLRVMAPMVATVEEAAWFADRCRAHGIATVGVMIEVPAAALVAREVLEVVDFASIGTNDLARFLFAADRRSAADAPLLDPWQPALLRLVGLVGEAAAATGTPVGLCGEAAADPALAPVLVGLGVSSLSMTPAALPAVRAALAAATLDECRARAAAARAAPDAPAARAAAAPDGPR